MAALQVVSPRGEELHYSIPIKQVVQFFGFVETTFCGDMGGWGTDIHHTIGCIAPGTPHTPLFGKAAMGSVVNFHECGKAKAVFVPSFEAGLVA